MKNIDSPLNLTDSWETVFESVEKAKVETALKLEQERTKQAEIDYKNRSDRRETFLSFFGGGAGILAAVVVFMFVVMQSCSYSAKGDERNLLRQQEKTQQVELCLKLSEPAERQLCIISLETKVKETE